MTQRRLDDWLGAYLHYSGIGEAPARMRFWCGVSAIAGALRRKVWIDQVLFKWYPNFYIILVAPPGVVAKSTTSDVSMKLLEEVPGPKFGPDIVTWPALVQKFAGAAEAFEYPAGVWNTMSPLTLAAGELGNLLNPQDREMIDLYVTLWDGKTGNLQKETKTSGNDTIPNPWINMIGCTTPAWIAGTFPEYMIGGGFTSRCVFVYAEEKEILVAYPKKQAKSLPERAALREALIADLSQIATLCGEYELTPEAEAWGETWYHRHHSNPPPELNDARFGGYLARKQTHMHKLAMVIAASRGNTLRITAEHLAIAERMLTDAEPDMVKVFERIGRSPTALAAERLLNYIRRMGKVEWDAAFRFIHPSLPNQRDFDNVLTALVRSGFLTMSQEGAKTYLVPGVSGGKKPQLAPVGGVE